MFYCSAGHLTRQRESQILIPTKIRVVENLHVLSSHEKKDIVHGKGFEIAEERPFRVAHAVAFDPIIVGTVQRKHEFTKPEVREEK